MFLQNEFDSIVGHWAMGIDHLGRHLFSTVGISTFCTPSGFFTGLKTPWEVRRGHHTGNLGVQFILLKNEWTLWLAITYIIWYFRIFLRYVWKTGFRLSSWIEWICNFKIDNQFFITQIKLENNFKFIAFKTIHINWLSLRRTGISNESVLWASLTE